MPTIDPIQTAEWYRRPRPVEGKAERKMWGGVLRQALMDALGVTAHGRPLVRNKNLPPGLQTDALEWIRNDEEDIGSFVWICHLLDQNPRRIRKLMSRHLTDNGQGGGLPTTAPR